MPNNDFDYTGGFREPKWMSRRKVRVTPMAPRGTVGFSTEPVVVTPYEPRGTVWFPIPVGGTGSAIDSLIAKGKGLPYSKVPTEPSTTNSKSIYIVLAGAAALGGLLLWKKFRHRKG